MQRASILELQFELLSWKLLVIIRIRVRIDAPGYEVSDSGVAGRVMLLGGLAAGTVRNKRSIFEFEGH